MQTPQLTYHAQLSLDCLDTPEKEPPPLKLRLSPICPPSARLQPCPLPLATTRKCLCEVVHWRESVGRTPRSTEETSLSQGSGEIVDRAMRVRRATRPCQSSSTTGGMQIVGCSTTSASPTQLRKGGAKFLARIKSNGHDAEKRRSSLALGAIMRCGSLAYICGQHGGAVRIVTSSTARTSLAFSYHYILIPSSYHHIHQQNLPLLVPSNLSNRISIGFRDRRPCLTLFGRTPLSCFPPLRLVPLSHPDSCTRLRVYPSSAPILAV